MVFAFDSGEPIVFASTTSTIFVIRRYFFIDRISSIIMCLFVRANAIATVFVNYNHKLTYDQDGDKNKTQIVNIYLRRFEVQLKIHQERYVFHCEMF